MVLLKIKEKINAVKSTFSNIPSFPKIGNEPEETKKGYDSTLRRSSFNQAKVAAV